MPTMRLLDWCGVAAPLVYVVTVIAGGASTPGYNHLHDPVSALTEAGSNDVFWINIGFLLYNLLVAAFALSALQERRSSRLWTVIFGLLLLTALSGALMWPLPQDPIGAPASPAGIAHIALAAVESLSSILIVGLAIRALWQARHRRLALFSAVCLGLIVPFGIGAAAATAGHWQFMGLFERVTIGAFEAWIGVVALSRAIGPLAADLPSQ